LFFLFLVSKTHPMIQKEENLRERKGGGGGTYVSDNTDAELLNEMFSRRISLRNYYSSNEGK